MLKTRSIIDAFSGALRQLSIETSILLTKNNTDNDCKINYVLNGKIYLHKTQRKIGAMINSCISTAKYQAWPKHCFKQKTNISNKSKVFDNGHNITRGTRSLGNQFWISCKMFTSLVFLSLTNSDNAENRTTTKKETQRFKKTF